MKFGTVFFAVVHAHDHSCLSIQFKNSILSNSPCKKDSTRGNGMQKGANFFTTLFLFYHTFDWLNQQNLPKLQAAVYLFIFN